MSFDAYELTALIIFVLSFGVLIGAGIGYHQGQRRDR